MTKYSEMKNRIAYIDVSKGILILPTHDKFMNVTFDNCIVHIIQSFAFQCATHFLCFLSFYIVVKTVYDSKYLSAIVGKW